MKWVSSSSDPKVTLITWEVYPDCKKIKRHDENTKYHEWLWATVLFLVTHSRDNYIRVLLSLSARNTWEIIKCEAGLRILKGYSPSSSAAAPSKTKVNLTLHHKSQQGETNKRKKSFPALVAFNPTPGRVPKPLSTREPLPRSLWAAAPGSHLPHAPDLCS